MVGRLGFRGSGGLTRKSCGKSWIRQSRSLGTEDWGSVFREGRWGRSSGLERILRRRRMRKGARFARAGGLSLRPAGSARAFPPQRVKLRWGPRPRQSGEPLAWLRFSHGDPRLKSWATSRVLNETDRASRDCPTHVASRHEWGTRHPVLWLGQILLPTLRFAKDGAPEYLW